MIFKLLKGLLLVCLFFILLGLYTILLSPKAFRARENERNIEKIKLRMSLNKMLKIMGNPDEMHLSNLNDGSWVYFYQPSFASSSGIEIYVKDNKVTKVIDSE